MTSGIIQAGRKYPFPVGKLASWRLESSLFQIPIPSRSIYITTGARRVPRHLLTSDRIEQVKDHGVRSLSQGDDLYTLYIVVYYYIVFELPFFTINICV